MTTLKRRLSIVLAAAMIASNMTSVAFADVEGPTGWQLEDDGWHFYRNSDGKEMVDRERMTQGKWYSFDANGVMYSDALIDVNTDEVTPEGETVTGKRYAFPDGHLAEAGTWVLLDIDSNGNGTKHYHDDENGKCSGTWYFFHGDDLVDPETGENYNPERGVMVTDKEKEKDGAVYYFDEYGKMYSRQWRQDPDTKNWYYYQYDGERAENKYLYVESNWYYFDDEGISDGKPLGTASASNAEFATVKSITPVEESLSGALGKTVEVTYQVNLATSSNADEEPVYNEDYHDVWVLQKRSGKFTDPIIDSEGNCTFQYTISSLEPEKLYLVVDGKTSGAVTITVSKEDTTSASVLDIASLLDSVNISDVGISVDSVRASLVTYYKADTESVKAEYTDPATIDAIKTLEDAYAMEKQISVSTKTEGASELLPKGSSVTITGAALNADSKGTVELKVDAGTVTDKKLEEIKTEMSADGTLVTAPFDITFYVNGNKKTSLTLPVIISMPLPEGFEPNETALYHIHGSDLEEVDFTDGEEDGTISFAADRFSTYVFVKETNSGSNSGDDNTTNNTASNTSSHRDDDDDDDSYSSRRGKGQWMKNATGWWYQNANGSYPSNAWMELEYANIKDWYRFNLQGYLHTGWFTDSDGEIYYLNPVSNGFLGAMLTGWHQIDGYWYYFNPVSNGHKGALLRNTTTPDGYRVNEKGQRVD